MTHTPKRRWYQFSLKMLLVGMTVLCIGPGGYVAYEQAKARKQKAAVEAIKNLGGHVEYYQTTPARSPLMRQILGDESFGNVWLVHFNNVSNTELTDAGLKHLAGLQGLERLMLRDTQVTDAGLVHVANLKGLTSLWLDGTQITDAGLVHLIGLTRLDFLILSNTPVTDAGLVPLANLKGLTYLNLTNTHVTDAGIAELQKALPNCEILR